MRGFPQTGCMGRDSVKHYFRLRPVASAFAAMPGVAIGVGLSWLLASWINPPAVIALLIAVAGLVAGFAISRLFISTLMGWGGRPKDVTSD